MEANGINYYKGVLLCSRPNETPSIDRKKEFCARVFAHESIGLGPVKLYDEHKTRKRVLPVLNKHKEWLANFKKDIHQHKEQEEKEKLKQHQKLEKIKKEGSQNITKLKNGSTQLTNAKPEEVSAAPKRAQASMKKKDKPVWAKTAEQVQNAEQKQVDDLLNYFNEQNTSEIKDYVSDGEVKNILIDLKSKIQKLKEQEDWRNDRMKRIEDDKSSANQGREKDKDDILSRMSRNSGAQSVSSQKTAERVEELENKKKDKNWQKMTISDKKTMASVDEQIAKHVADEVLRNYPHLKHHSNQSMRVLLEKQAREQIKS